MSNTCHPDHIADADKKVQPARCPHCGYTPDAIPSGSVLYAWANCEHRGSHAQPSSAPLPVEVAANVRAARNALRSGLYPRKCTIRGLLSSIDSQARRLAEAEAENGRFAGMLEDSVSGWRKLYTEERAERVRIEGVLLNDVQAERQESDEHINGLNVVIKTQDKTIRDLKSRVVELAADWQVQFAKAEAAEASVRELEAENAAAKQEVTDMDSACNTLLSSVCAERDSLEAFKTRVMEWARGEQCGVCENNVHPHEKCFDCSGNGGETGSANNWTPPQAWEVGE